MMDYTRRKFLTLCGRMLLVLGLGDVLPVTMSRAAARSAGMPQLNVVGSGVLPVPQEHFRAIVFCDSQCGYGYDTWAQTYQAAFNRHGTPDCFTVIGDLVDNGAADWQWESWQNAMDDRASEATFIPVMGNHECYGLEWTNHLPDGYLQRFAVPANGSKRFPGYYYAFDYGPAHFIVLNTQWLELDPLRPGLRTEELNWLRQQQATSQGTSRRWQIVLMHKDVLAYDEPQPDGTTGSFSYTGRTFMPLLETLGADLVLTGHMHAYRNRGHLRQFAPSDTGPVYVMCGRAGDEYYLVPADPRDKVAAPDDHQPSYVTLNCDAHNLILAAWTVKGAQLDSFTLHKT